MTAPTVDPATLTKVIVNCTPRAMAALDRVTDLTDDSKTDTINRALQLYAALVATADGKGFTFEVRPGVERHVHVDDTRAGQSSFGFRFFIKWRRR